MMVMMMMMIDWLNFYFRWPTKEGWKRRWKARVRRLLFVVCCFLFRAISMTGQEPIAKLSHVANHKKQIMQWIQWIQSEHEASSFTAVSGTIHGKTRNSSHTKKLVSQWYHCLLKIIHSVEYIYCIICKIPKGSLKYYYALFNNIVFCSQKF